MTWPPTATRAEILRILEINRIHPEWIITRAETEAVLALLAEDVQVMTDLAGAEATNGVLDEEVARLRAEIKRWKDTLEMELTHSQAWVAQVVRAERERCIRLTCRYCADGWEVDSEGLHTIPKSGYVTPGHLCRAEALRAPSIEEVSGSVDPDNLPDLRTRDD